MASTKPNAALKAAQSEKRARTLSSVALMRRVKQATHLSVIEEASAAGLLDGDKSEHVSFRAPPALVEAAKRATGVESTSDLGMLALAMLAQADPVVTFFKRTRGRLGKEHTLDY